MASFNITPLTARTGVEVIGLDFTQPIDTDTGAHLRRAFAEHHVLVMRDQRFTADQFETAAQVFGEIQLHDKRERHVPGHPGVDYVSNDQIENGRRIIPGETFHTDHSNHPRPLGQITEESRSKLPPPGVHPLVRTHPENGRKALFLNPVRMEAIVGMDDKEALALIEELMRHAIQKKYEYRHKWRHGDWVLWDNRSVMHQANPDYDMRERRYLYRLMLKGETPV
jgi:taurine dioxygenase